MPRHVRAFKHHLKGSNYESILLEEKFNLTAEFCSHIEEHTNTTEYTAVEQEVKI